MTDVLTNVRASAVTRARRLLQGKHRATDGAFLAEGPQACREAVRYADVRELFVTPEVAERYDDIVENARLRGANVLLCDEAVVAALSTAVAPQGMVAVVADPRHQLEAVMRDGVQLVVALAAARDPGNVGAVIRVADAVGADAVVASPDTVDAGNPKVVRASAGSLFHVPVVEDVALSDAVAHARRRGLQVLAADGSGMALGSDIDLSLPTMWVFGNEAWGLPDDVLAHADRVVALPIYGKAESLNLATAAAVLLYASASAHAAHR